MTLGTSTLGGDTPCPETQQGGKHPSRGFSTHWSLTTHPPHGALAPPHRDQAPSSTQLAPTTLGRH